jgi:hypothetical protein
MALASDDDACMSLPLADRHSGPQVPELRPPPDGSSVR